MPKEILVSNIPYEANAINVTGALETFIKGKIIRCELTKNKLNNNPFHINGGLAFVTLDDDDADDLMSRADYNPPFCMNRPLNIQENKRGRRRRNIDPLINANEPTFPVSNIELGNWAGQLPIVDYKRRGKRPLQTQRWKFLCDWRYPDYYIEPKICISKESDAIFIDGFALLSDLKNEKRIKIPLRWLSDSRRGILLDVRELENGFISLYISLKCSPILLRKTNKYAQRSTNTRLLYHSFNEEEWVRTYDWTGIVNAFGKFLVYRLIINENLEEIQKYLNNMSIPGIQPRIPKCFVSCEQISKDSEFYLKGTFELLPFRIGFKLESLISHDTITIHEIMEYRIGEKLIELICEEKETIAWYALNQMTIQHWDPGDDRYNRRPVEIFEIALRSFRGEYDEWHPANPNIKLKETNRCAWVNHATITPTKIYFDGPEYESSNRTLRQYPEYTDRFIRVTFKDENFDRLFVNEQQYMDICDSRISNIFNNGFTISGRQYEFLAFSSSQLRENSCWFVSTDHELNANMIRATMGDFSEIKVPALYAARMGQCFTSTIGTLELEENQIIRIPDIERNNYIFSDGCGNISPGLAKLAARHYWGTRQNDEIPSVFQFRFGGCKGVVSVNPDLDGNVICLRPSQTKFEAPIATNLEIVKAVKNPLVAHLNRQIITVLSSLGVPDDIFIRLQNNAKADIDSMMRNPQKASEIVKRSSGTRECSHVTRTILSMIETGLMESNEPYLRGILECKRIFALKYLRYKARIPVPRGYMLFGVLDETGILEPEQVYIQTSTIISDNNTFRTANNKIRREHKVLTGPAVIARNPSLHPGDIRTVWAIDVPELSHLKNCVVFSQKGDRPLPNFLSGDGDEFFICFDERIFPKIEHDPMDYSPPERKKLDRPVVISDIHDFFIDFMKNDRIGMIGSLHLALADFHPEGIFHPQCLKLAELHSKAVDFNKTGVPVTESLPTTNEYPDFMENKTKKVYESQKILGQLYRNIELDQPRHVPLLNYDTNDNITPKRMFLAQGYEDYLEEAEVCRDTYNSEIRSLMKKFRVKTEPEIITSNILSFHRIDGRKTQDIRESISGTISFIIHKFRKHFLIGLQDNIDQYVDNDTYNVNIPITNETKAKASAWYYVTYHEEEFPDAIDDKRLLSFAWTVSDVLLKIREENMRI
ncbi:18903_t:CDS:10 [Racocetra persica]|uniref:18903_t:CDS:1 n=1 Tax=Racocetra persica TaxID=160502 RepID=A0ACA9KHC4_9GLOM|nr:18903_t:CDS:10 [Racocetra persica]